MCKGRVPSLSYPPLLVGRTWGLLPTRWLNFPTLTLRFSHGPRGGQQTSGRSCRVAGPRPLGTCVPLPPCPLPSACAHAPWVPGSLGLRRGSFEPDAHGEPSFSSAAPRPGLRTGEKASLESRGVCLALGFRFRQVPAPPAGVQVEAPSSHSRAARGGCVGVPSVGSQVARAVAQQASQLPATRPDGGGAALR